MELLKLMDSLKGFFRRSLKGTFKGSFEGSSEGSVGFVCLEDSGLVARAHKDSYVEMFLPEKVRAC